MIRDGVSDMHCMSDMYLADELKQKYVDKIIATKLGVLVARLPDGTEVECDNTNC